MLADFLRSAGVSHGRIKATLEAVTPVGDMKRRASREMRVALRQLEALADENLISDAVVRLISSDGLANIRGTGPTWAERRRWVKHVAEGHTPHCASRPDCGSEQCLCRLYPKPRMLPPESTANGFLLSLARTGLEEARAAGPARAGAGAVHPVEALFAIPGELPLLDPLEPFAITLTGDLPMLDPPEPYDDNFDHRGEDGRCRLCGSDQLVDLVGDGVDVSTLCVGCLSE